MLVLERISKVHQMLITTIIFLLPLTFLKCLVAQTWIKAGYWYAGSGYPVPDINSALFTHLICSFAHVNTSSYELSITPSSEPYISTFAEVVKKKNPSVVPLLSIWGGETKSFVGGEANSSIFFSMVSKSSRRKSFIESSIRTARSYGFHGLELFGANPDTPENMTNMGIFFDEWRAAVDLESNNSRLILTMAGYYSPVMNTRIYPLETIQRNLDWVHLMSYDYHMSSKDKHTAAHAALYDPLSRLNTDYGLKQWIIQGLPTNKLVLGLPYHGYAWTLLDPKNNTIGAPAKSVAISADGTVGYKSIKEYTKSYGATSGLNSTYVVNYCTFGSFWIGYDDVQAIQIKVSYAKEKGLLGYIVWQVPNDDNEWTLSKAAHVAEADGEADGEKRQRVLKILVPIISIAILLGATIYCLWNKIITWKGLWNNASEKRSAPPNLQVFSFANMKEATTNFSEENKLGEGGFGPVYKGKLLDGQEIAVKRLSRSSKQGSEEFKNELTLSAKLQHVHIVRLLGFCTEKEEKMLVYEYMPNRSLDLYLFDPVRRLSFDWEKRVRVIDGVTQGLLYLQEFSIYTVIHRDLKANNILLDAEMNPKISDFGIARIFKKNEEEASTGRIVGTYGCVPPEYVKRGVYSTKYDIYSFGVLLLQILSSKSNSCLYGDQKNLNLLEYAYRMWKDGNATDFLDPSLDDASSSCKLMRCLLVALLCVQVKWEDRPSMLEIYSMLKNETEALPTPKIPAFSITAHEIEENKFMSHKQFFSENMMTLSGVLPR